MDAGKYIYLYVYIRIYTYIFTCSSLFCDGGTSIKVPGGTVKTELRSILTETLIKTMKLIIILELCSRAAAVMRPHRSNE